MKTENLVQASGDYDNTEKYKIEEGYAYTKQEPGNIFI